MSQGQNLPQFPSAAEAKARMGKDPGPCEKRETVGTIPKPVTSLAGVLPSPTDTLFSPTCFSNCSCGEPLAW